MIFVPFPYFIIKIISTMCDYSDLCVYFCQIVFLPCVLIRVCVSNRNSKVHTYILSESCQRQDVAAFLWCVGNSCKMFIFSYFSGKAEGISTCLEFLMVNKLGFLCKRTAAANNKMAKFTVHHRLSKRI